MRSYFNPEFWFSFFLKQFSFFQTTLKDLGSPEQLVIGLNPPFGKNNELAIMFVQHAARFSPRIIVLIVPPMTPVPYGYTTIFEDRHSCKGETFYVPGSSARSWNKDVPAFRILARSDLADNIWGDKDWQEIAIPKL